MERLQKVMSQAGVSSRRAAEKIILEGRVSVNGRVVKELGSKIDPEKDELLVDGKVIKTMTDHVYFILNKPKGVISTAKDERGRKTVIDLLAKVPERIYPVGRLDNNTEGLLLLTNDGELMNSLLHPKYKIYKTYIAKVEGNPSEDKLDQLRAGIELEDGMTAPAEVYIAGTEPMKNITTLEIIIHEGRNRQVRRMCEAIGCSIKSLKRIEFAGLTLSGVHRGQYRALTAREVDRLKSIQ